MRIGIALAFLTTLFGAAPIAPTPTDPTANERAEQTRPLIRPGEDLHYTVQSSRMGRLGTAEMKVQAGEIIDGMPVYELSFAFSGKVALFKIRDETRSWLRVDSLCTVRYSKHERSPISRRDEDVVVDRTLNQWADGKNRAPLASDHPLDELSFIYLVRSLDLKVSEVVEIRRHFDVRRNPVRIEAVAKQDVDGRAVVVYEMRVPDPRQKNGTSSIRFFISDDAARIPLRIESSMPMAGTIVMTLASAQSLPIAASR
ncbi:MAG TPA: DUF3108 domain-containing protein [Longimicrobiales bacterium]